MIAGEKHIIEKIKVKLTTTSTSNGKELTNSFSPYFTDNVLPGIETCLDDIFRGNNKKTVRINQLKLSLNIDDVLRSKDELISQLKSILEDQLRDQVLESKDSFQRNDVEDKTQNVKVLDNELHYFEAVCFFLERGICPWWLSNEKLSSILEEKNLNSFFASHIDKIDALYAHLNSSKIAFKRFIGQFSNGILFWFLQQINSNIEKLTAAESTLIENDISYFSRNERIVFFQTLFEITDRKKNMTQNQLNQLISLVNVVINRSNEDKQVDQYEHSPWVNILSIILEKKKSEIINALDHVSKNPVEAILESTKENEDKLELPDEGLYIDNAGIIVLHPFLKHFFTNIDLLKDDELKDKELAVQLLHYIAT
ncbi:MAG TPA: contractile injection system tape measure protein, partial [Brumimicrobium sp.]|nr:contractile injection system tape measure protein [Brumimicrobium sp.]